MNPRMRSRMPASIGSNQASPANSPVPSAAVVLSCSMAWSPPALERRSGSLRQAGDYATTRFHHLRDGTRLDRLAPVKGVAQVAAVIGREFSRDLLAAAAGLSDDELRAALDRLVAAELVFRRGEASHAFKHALVRDAAYESLLRSRRQELHARIAAVLEAEFPGEA